MEKKKWKQWIYWFSLAVAIVIVYKTLDSFSAVTDWVKNLLDLLMPFIMAILVAYIFYIPARKVETIYNKAPLKIIAKRARVLAILTVYIIAGIAIGVLIKFILPTISTSVIELVNSLPGYYESAIKYVNELPEDSILNKVEIKAVIANLQNVDVASFIHAESISGYAAKSVIGVTNFIFNLFITIIVSIYLLYERTQILQFMKKLVGAVFKNKTYKRLGSYFRKTNEIFFNFISSQIIDGIVVGILISIALSIMKVKYGILLGFLIGLFNIIPYFGAIVASGISILITALTGGIGQAVTMAIVVIVLQQIDANIINPKIVGSSLKLSPILIIFAVTIGGAYFGVLGMFLAVPVIAILKILVLDYIELRNRQNQNKETKSLE